MTSEPLPPRVSDEDREAAIIELSKHYTNVKDPGPGRCVCGAVNRWPDHIVEVLVSHGWGPRPVIYSETILDHVSTLEAATSLIDVLLQNGIEVRGD